MPDLVVSDIAATKIALAVEAAATANGVAIAAHAATLVALFDSTNVAMGGKPGSLAALASQNAAQLTSLTAAVRANTEAIDKLTVATGKIASSVEVLTKAAGTIQYTMTKQLTTQQMVAADQIKNNKFNQVTTNEAKERAGLPKTELKPQDTLESVKTAIDEISVINAQTTATTIIFDQLAESTKQGFTIAQQWIVESTFAKWISSYWTESKLQIELLFADEKAKKIVQEKIDAVRNARQNPMGAK